MTKGETIKKEVEGMERKGRKVHRATLPGPGETMYEGPEPIVRDYHPSGWDSSAYMARKAREAVWIPIARQSREEVKNRKRRVQ